MRLKIRSLLQHFDTWRLDLLAQRPENKFSFKHSLMGYGKVWNLYLVFVVKQDIEVNGTRPILYSFFPAKITFDEF